MIVFRIAVAIALGWYIAVLFGFPVESFIERAIEELKYYGY